MIQKALVHQIRKQTSNLMKTTIKNKKRMLRMNQNHRFRAQIKLRKASVSMKKSSRQTREKVSILKKRMSLEIKLKIWRSRIKSNQPKETIPARMLRIQMILRVKRKLLEKMNSQKYLKRTMIMNPATVSLQVLKVKFQ